MLLISAEKVGNANTISPSSPAVISVRHCESESVHQLLAGMPHHMGAKEVVGLLVREDLGPPISFSSRD